MFLAAVLTAHVGPALEKQSDGQAHAKETVAHKVAQLPTPPAREGNAEAPAFHAWQMRARWL
jgi:hypothetical protein